MSSHAEQAASQVAVPAAKGFETFGADAESNPNSEDWSQPLMRTFKRNRRARKAKAAAEGEAQQDLIERHQVPDRSRSGRQPSGTAAGSAESAGRPWRHGGEGAR